MRRCLILFVWAGACVLPYATAAGAGNNPGDNAQRAYIDPETGKLAAPPPSTRPQPQHASETSAQRRKVIAAPSRAYRRADGALVLHLGPESRIKERVKLDKNGKLRRTDHE